MGSEWPYVALDDLTDLPITYGVVKPGPEDPGGIRFIRGGDVDDGRVLVENLRTITREVSQQYKRTLLRGGEVVVSLVGNPGQVAIVPPSLRGANIARQVGLVRLANKVDSRFVKYFLLSPIGQNALGAHSIGSVQRVINLRDLKTVRVPVPRLQTQQAIACILGALDDKIELNRRMNKTLEAMARAIFKSWFVDFDPVRAKAAGQQPPGLAPHIAALFPDSFEASELGEVPRGWRLYHLADIIDVNPSRQIRKGIVAPYLDMAGMPTQGHAPESWIKRAFGSGMKFMNGDTLVARITPCLENGKTAFVDFLQECQVGWGSTEYIVLRPRSPIPSIFAYLLARNEDFRLFAIQRMSGSSGRQRVPADSLLRYQLAAPQIDSEMFPLFGRLVEPAFSRAKAAKEQSRTLAALRDALIPKLISGEIRVREAERVAARRL